MSAMRVIDIQVFHNAPAVEAALKGRLLILEGVQKAGICWDEIANSLQSFGTAIIDELLASDTHRLFPSRSAENELRASRQP